jgi:hypothetical protein
MVPATSPLGVAQKHWLPTPGAPPTSQLPEAVTQVAAAEAPAEEPTTSKRATVKERSFIVGSLPSSRRKERLAAQRPTT